jgi:hypothetical protein
LRPPVCRAAQLLSQRRIRYTSRRNHAANAENDQHERTLAHFGALEIGLQNLQQPFNNVLVRRVYAAWAARHVRWQSDQRAAAFPVIEMIAREIGVDDSVRPLIGRRPSALALPRLGCLLAQEPADRLRVEVLLLVEMPVESAVGQSGTFHDLADRNLLEALAVEQASGAFEDLPTRGKFVLRRIGHVVLRVVQAKDDVEHLLPSATLP